MHNSSFVMTNFIKEKLATGYDAKGNAIPFYQTRPTDMPQGSMFSTGRDVANFMIAQLNDGKFKNNQILQKETVEDMQKNKICFTSLNTYEKNKFSFWENFKMLA
nr:hypothetical protein [Bacillus cereus]